MIEPSNVKKKRLLGELVRYGISGGLVTLSNVGSYELLLRVGLVYTIANIIALVFSKTVGYLLNKFWVYKSKTATKIDTVKELFRFILARGFTGVVDYVGLIVLVECFHMNKSLSKWIVVVAVIVLNYVLGKLFVFTPKAETDESASL